MPLWKATAATNQARWALLALVFALPLKDVFELDHLLEIGPIAVVSLTKLAALAFFICFVRYVRLARPALRFDALHFMLFGLLAFAALSALQARSPGTAVATSFRYASFVALFFALTQLLADRVLVRHAMWALLTSCALAGAIALRGFLLEQLPVATLPHGNPNDVAFMLGTTLPIGFGLARNAAAARAQQPWRAYAEIAVAALMTVIIAASVVLSASRSALVGLAAAALLQIVLDRRYARPILAGCAVAALAVALLVLINPAHVLRGVRSKHQVAQANVTNRLQAWGEAIRLTAAHPWFGVGPGNFQFYYADRWQPGIEPLGVVHNTFLDIAAELGVPAACLFLGFLGLTFVRLSAIARGALAPPGFASALRSGLVVAVVAGLFLSEQFFPPFWLLGALAYGVWQEGRDQESTAP